MHSSQEKTTKKLRKTYGICFLDVRCQKRKFNEMQAQTTMCGIWKLLDNMEILFGIFELVGSTCQFG